MDTHSNVGHMLGGKATFDPAPKTSHDWHAWLEDGLPLNALESFKQITGLADSPIAKLLGISDKTLQRARQSRTRLDAVTSDRLYRAARLVALANDVLESQVRAIDWLGRVQIGLGGAIPFALMTTEVGAQQVEQLLQRIEHGVYS